MHSFSDGSTQLVAAFSKRGRVERRFPGPSERVGPGPLTWGRAEEIGSPAYWSAQAWMWEIDEPEHFRLGDTLEEEVLACLLGGHGIPAEVGLAAYDRLRAEMRRDPAAMSDADHLLALLSEPLDVRGRPVRYRFARQKASFAAAAMSRLPLMERTGTDRGLRDRLTCLPGIGLKTASWIVRNWRASDEVCILDVHILRAGRMLGVFPEPWRVERHYRLLEDAYLAFARDIGTRASMLDSVMWMTLRQLPVGLACRA